MAKIGGNLLSVITHGRLIPILPSHDSVVNSCLSTGLIHFLSSRIRIRVLHVVRDRRVENVWVLGHHRDVFVS